MTYLEIVNKVLRLMREDAVATVVEPDDVVVDLVLEFVNDAKRYVEDAHNWNALRETFNIATVADDPLYSLTNGGKYVKIEYIHGPNKELRKVPLKQIHYSNLNNSDTGEPRMWSVDGQDANGDAQVRFFPTPDAVYNINAYGYKRQPDLAADADELLIPAQPVVYRALALALRERGEVGGQTATEIFGVAQQHLSDAIARDADMSHEDFVWYTV